MLLLWAGIAALLLLPNLLTRGLFVDGLVYSSISRNLSMGIGSMWTPYYAQVKGAVFIEHPPLFFWLQSIWFSTVGNHLFTERLFSLVCYLGTAWLLFRLCRYLFSSVSTAYFSVLLVTLTPIVYWVFGNNMMEMLLVAPIVVAFHILHRRFHEKPHWWDLPVIALLFLFFLLIKGPVALGVAVMPFTFLFSVPTKKVFKDGLLVLVLSGASLFLLMQFDGASANLHAYMDAQIMGVLSGDRVSEFATSRWKLLKDLAQQLILPTAIPLGLWLLTRKKPAFVSKYLPLLFTALLFSLPFLISRKQHAYYLVPALSFFALFNAALFQKAFQTAVSLKKGLVQKVLGGLGLMAGGVAVVFMIAQYCEFSRDLDTQRDLIIIDEAIDVQLIGLEDDLHRNWSLYGYAMRFHGLDLSSIDGLDYMVASRESVLGYERLKLPTQKFHLFKKKERLLSP